MLRRSLLLAAVATALLSSPAGAADYVPDEVIVRYAPQPDPVTRVVKVAPGSTLGETLARLRARPDVLSATPNYIARASFVPNDPDAPRLPAAGRHCSGTSPGPSASTPRTRGTTSRAPAALVAAASSWP